MTSVVAAAAHRRRRRPPRTLTPGRQRSRCVDRPNPSSSPASGAGLHDTYMRLKLRTLPCSPHAEEDAVGPPECAPAPPFVRAAQQAARTDPAATPTPLPPPDPIRFGYSVRRTAPQTTSPAGPSSSTAGPSSALSPPLPPPARARVPLPFENGSSDSGEVEVDRVTLRRQQGDRLLPTIPTPMTTVEASLQSGTVAEAAAGLRKGKGKVVKRMVGRPANAKSTSGQ
jgi:hypothetical protein